MAIKILFEDSKETPSSILLKQSKFGNNIYFSEGCHNVLSKLKELYQDGDIVFIFYDVSPNNRYTILYYNDLVQEIAKNYKDVYVIPIICIEYYICKCFIQYNYMYEANNAVKELVNAIVKDFDYNNIPKKVRDDTKSKLSLESLYKYIIANQRLKCLSNSFEYNEDGSIKIDSLKGRFYNRDCSCNDRYCRLKCKDSQSLKAERLYTTLPLFVVVSKDHKELLNTYGISIIRISIEQVIDNMQNMYNEICNNMGVNTFKVFGYSE